MRRRVVAHPGISTSVAVLGLRRSRGHGGRGWRGWRSGDGQLGVLVASSVGRRRRWWLHVDHFRCSIAELVRVGWSGSSRRWCVGLRVQLLSERSGGGCALKPAFLNRYRGWRLSALLTYKMNIFGGKYSIAVLTLQQSLMSRCRSRLLSFFSSRRRRRLGPETFARRIFYWSAEFHVRTSQQPARAIKNVLHANTLSAPKHTDYYDLCVLSLFTGTLNVVNLQLLPNGLLPLQYFSKKHLKLP